MTSKQFYYLKCCKQREFDLICFVREVFPGQTITGDYVFSGARLCDIAKGSQATQRVIDWCRARKIKREGAV